MPNFPFVYAYVCFRSCLRFPGLFGIHFFYLPGIMFRHDTSAQFQRIGQFAILHRERFGEQGKTLNLLVGRQLALTFFNMRLYQLVNPLVLCQIGIRRAICSIYGSLVMLSSIACGAIYFPLDVLYKSLIRSLK